MKDIATKSTENRLDILKNNFPECFDREGNLIINKLEESFPINLEEKWDNSGLLIGDRNSEISAIQISLDITDSVIDKAIENGCELIITHHPIIFESIKKINDSTILGKKILKLIKNGINVYSAHTNLDSAKDGLNNYIAQKLLAKDAKIMDENFYSVYKMNIFVSKSILAEVLSILNGSRELEFLEYKRVTYTSKVTERVLVNNEIKELDSYNIQIMGEKNKLYSILNKIREKHSISEIAFEILPLENKHKTGTGLGRFFKLENPMSLEEYISFVKDKLNLSELNNEQHQEILKIIFHYATEKLAFNEINIGQQLSEKANAELSCSLMTELQVADDMKFIDDCLKTIHLAYLNYQYEQHRLKADELERMGESSFLQELAESQRIKNEIKKIYNE